MKQNQKKGEEQIIYILTGVVKPILEEFKISSTMKRVILSLFSTRTLFSNPELKEKTNYLAQLLFSLFFSFDVNLFGNLFLLRVHKK